MGLSIRIYKYLYRNYWITSRPRIFFNQPIKKLDCQYRTTLWADVNFNNKERQLIQEALIDFLYFCNGCVELDIVFNLNSNDLNFIKNNNVLIKSNSREPILKDWAPEGGFTIGLCKYNEKARALYLAADLLTDPISFKCTLVHELGHFVSLAHLPKTSIMQHQSCEQALFMNYIDAKEMAKVWGLCPQQLRYFK